MTTTLPTPGKVIFLAMPTAGTTEDWSATAGKLRDAVYRDIAALHLRFPDYTFVAPMLQDYNLLPYMSVEPNWEQWGDHCRRLIERCDEMWVLMYNGWRHPVHWMDPINNTSKGVAGELVHATKCRVPISFIAPEAL